MTPTVEPFLKWAGGKRWLVRRHWNLFPPNYKRYVEPFVGSGAVFFHLQPKRAILGDRNSELIDTYRAVRAYPRDIARILKRYHQRHNAKFYYAMRGTTPVTPVERAARFIYLNRVCWNGLYRVNRNGTFNVPIGTKTRVISPDEDFALYSATLSKAMLYHADFETLIDKATDGDFVFVDPPYTVRHNLNGFRKYNEVLFTWSDQIRLRDAVRRAIRRGAKVVMTNAAHSSVTNLYSGFAEVLHIERTSAIAADKQYRGAFHEVVIRC